MDLRSRYRYSNSYLSTNHIQATCIHGCTTLLSINILRFHQWEWMAIGQYFWRTAPKSSILQEPSPWRNPWGFPGRSEGFPARSCGGLLADLMENEGSARHFYEEGKRVMSSSWWAITPGFPNEWGKFPWSGAVLITCGHVTVGPCGSMVILVYLAVLSFHVHNMLQHCGLGGITSPPATHYSHKTLSCDCEKEMKDWSL